MNFDTRESVEEKLSEFADEKYRLFTSRLTNTKYPILGVRIPQLQNLAKQILKGDYNVFLSLPFTYFEHHILRGMVIAMNKEGEKEHLSLFDEYVPYIDDWEGVDLIASRYNCKSESYFSALRSRLNGDREYSVRFALIAILHNFASDKTKAPAIIGDVRDLTTRGYLEKFLRGAKERTHSGGEKRLGGYIPASSPMLTGTAAPPAGYYVMMGAAWLLSVLYLTDKAAVLDYIKDGSIDIDTRLKTISKILDSFRVSKEEKQYLRILRGEIRQGK